MMEGGKTILWRMIIFCMSMTIVRGDFSLEVRFHSYQNPLHAAAGHQGDCCDGADFSDPPHCSSACDNEFQFSLVNGETGTAVGEFFTDVVQRNNDYLVFSPGEGSTLGGVPNPVVFKGLDSSILEFLELHITVFDDDNGASQHDFIDTITMRFEHIALSTVNFTAPSVHSGKYGFAKATLSFGLECAENYFGENCTIFCIDADSDAIGHYVCDDMGNIVCRDGYSNPSIGCTEFASTISCSNEDKTMIYITVTSILAVISILLIPTTAMITVALMKLRQRKLNTVQCECSSRMKMEGNPSYHTPQVHHSVIHNEMETSTHHHNATGKRYFTTNRQNDNLSHCQAYAVSTLSLATIETSVELEGTSAFAEESEYSKASISAYSENATEGELGPKRIHASQSGYEDVWELDEENYASLKRVVTNTDDNDTPDHEPHYEILATRSEL